ncbi:MAG TPA: thioesterase family protein [Planctomycetota bacterium]|nr:thioesterase family protein [Planctomycetota bacterium]
MASEYKLIRRVEFSDTDMAGIMHFSNYYRFMEAAEHAFIRSLGLSVVPTGFDPPIGWPRVASSCEYKRPLKYDDEVEIHLQVSKKTEKAVTYTCTFRKVGDPEVCAVGSITVVCVTIRQGKMQATFIPKEYADKIDVAV